jgi:hypothetical protein
VAIIGQDVIRRQILATGDDQGGLPIALIEMITRHLLDRGMDVIIEGILNAGRYADMLVQLVADNRGISRSYIWDLSFPETLRRHATKPVATEFGETQMRQWWRGFQPIAGLDEQVVGPAETLDEVVRRVLTDCWPASAPS